MKKYLEEKDFAKAKHIAHTLKLGMEKVFGMIKKKVFIKDTNYLSEFVLLNANVTAPFVAIRATWVVRVLTARFPNFGGKSCDLHRGLVQW